MIRLQVECLMHENEFVGNLLKRNLTTDQKEKTARTTSVIYFCQKMDKYNILFSNTVHIN